MVATTRLIAAAVLFGITVSAGAQPASQPKWKADRKNPYSSLFTPPKSLDPSKPLAAPETPAPVAKCETSIVPETSGLDSRLARQLQRSGTRYTMRAVTPNCDRR